MLKFFKGLALTGTVALLSACGQNSMTDAFKNISIKNLDSNGNAVVELKTEVGGSNIVFSNATLPITDPKSGKQYGTVSMERTADGKNMLTISANVTGIKLGNVLPDNKLPNGSDVPVSGLSKLVALPAGQNSRIYLGTTATGDTLLLGAAIAVQQFDNLSSFIPGASVFSNLSPNAGATGLGGFFTSTESGKSGLAIFIQTNLPGSLVPQISSKALAGSAVQFREQSPTSEQAQYFGYFLNRWSRNKTSLKVK